MKHSLLKTKTCCRILLDRDGDQATADLVRRTWVKHWILHIVLRLGPHQTIGRSSHQEAPRVPEGDLEDKNQGEELS